MEREFSVAEVSAHNKKGDAWLIIDGNVYDCSKFARMHPGGEAVLLQLAGTDATEEFFSLHRAEVLTKYKRLIIGSLKAEERKPSVVGGQLEPGYISSVPYAEPSAWQGQKSPYYKETHYKFRKALREFFEKEIYPDAMRMNPMDECPDDAMHEKLGKAGVFAAMMGPGPWIKHFPMLGGVKPEEFDYFHEQIVHEEKNRMGLPGFQDGIGVGMVIGLPPVAVFGPNGLKEQVVGEVLSGKKKICLAISEPYAGSDVANIRTVATKTPCGKFYEVTGVKKWITNGSFSDYFTTAVRTGGPGMGGISMLLVPRSAGLSTKKIKTSYSGSAGTAYIIYDKVKVPVGNLLGKENQGFKIIMSNFNHERWFIVAGVVASMRMIVGESFKWSMQRRAFGKPLAAQPVIRGKLANMIAGVESMQAWLDHITYQMNNLSYAEQSKYLAGPIALLKLKSTRVCLQVSDDACQILGGRAITRSGMGARIERMQRAVKYGAILGGSEEIMGDLGVKMAMKGFPKIASKL